MAVDFFIVLPFFSLVFINRRTIFFLSVVAALLVLGAFSVFPVGVGELIFFLALMITQVLVNFFDASSFLSRVISFISVIFVYVVLVMIAGFFFFELRLMGLFIRGGLFFMRLFLAGIFLWLTMIAVNYALDLIHNAFLEEKII